MLPLLPATGLHLRLLYTSFLKRLGFGENAFLMPVAVLVGVVTAGAAVAFHELIVHTRDALYGGWASGILYGRGLPLLVLFPALGGLAVGLFSTYVMRGREGHG